MEKWLMDALGQGGAPERPSSAPPMQQQMPLVQYDPSYMFGGYGAYRPSWGAGMVKSMSSHQLTAQPTVPERPMLKSKSSHQLSSLNESSCECDFASSGTGSPSSAVVEGNLKPLDLAQPQPPVNQQPQQQQQQQRRHWPFIGLAAA